MIKNLPFASFIVVKVGELFCATTRVDGKIGFPGGKLESGETSLDAAIRESLEEGWLISGIITTPYFSGVYDNNSIEWFYAKHAIMLSDYKELGRISPLYATESDLMNLWLGNDDAIRAFSNIDQGVL